MDLPKVVTEIASRASASTVDFIWNNVLEWMGKKFNHHQNLEQNTHRLKRKYEELNSRKEDVELRLKVVLRPGKRLKKEVELWLANVQRINDKKQSVENEVREGLRFNRRLELGELVAEMIQEVEELHQKGRFFYGLVIDAPQHSRQIFPPTKLVGETKMEEIWDFLMNDETRLIGVYGMGGVGKTTVMQQINNRLLEQTDKFDDVIWVSVSKVLGVNKLQDYIASKFKVNLSDCEDETTRAAKLFSELREKKRCVWILDDMWEAFELNNVGILEPTSANGSKIVLTTRSLDVCRKMDCEHIKMELLSKDEAWNLFLDKIGRGVPLTPTLEATMLLVAEECARLPLAIITIARSMKGVGEEREWRHALTKLKEATGELTNMELVLEQLKYSYFRLKDEKLQNCLLYCVLYPEDFEFERKELIKCLIDEGIIEGTSRQAEFDKGHSILNKLENACLLESVTNGFNEKCVKMHDLIRDMALQIMSRRCMVKAGEQLRNLPNKEKWTEELERVSLMNNNISEIHLGALPRCPRLLTLLLLGNGGLRRIPDSFFVFMGGLRVLNLSLTGIEILPNSISDLENLAALLLRWCSNLTHVPSLAKLGKLRKLDLCGSGIVKVPEGMEMLINLKYLNLNAGCLRMLPAGILPQLFRLQCLIVWWGSKTLKIKADEVVGLKKLETFAGQFHDLNEFNTYVVFFWGVRAPHNYFLQVGPHGEFLDFDEEGSYFSKYVGLTGCSICEDGGHLRCLPRDIKELEIKWCHDVSSLCNVSTVHRTSRSLKKCKIIKCDGIEFVISCFSEACSLHKSLEVLQLEDLQSLHVLIRGEADSPPPFETFSRLKELRIFNCPNIRKLFMPGVLPNLKNLEEINVKNCSGMEEIITEKEQGEEEEEQGTGESSSHSIVNNDYTITLPKLRRLTLEDLPNLKSIVCSRAVMVCDSLQILTTLSCPKLKRFPLYLPMLNGQPSPPPALLQIEINDMEWWESLEWDHPNAKDVLEAFLLHIS